MGTNASALPQTRKTMIDLWTPARLSPAQYTRILDGLSYNAYLAQMAASLTRPDTGDPRVDRERDIVQLNYKRTLRAHRTYVVPDEVRALTARIRTPQTWMLLTEGWCGDSAQTLPYIVEIARTNPEIDVRVLLRDAHPDIMDLYETDGKRAIPIVAGFAPGGEELFHWGSRPAEAAALFSGLRARGVPKSEIYPKLHLWYGRDRGAAVTREFAALLGALTAAADFSAVANA